MRDFVLETDFFSFLIFFLTCWKSFCYIKYGCFQWFKDTNLKANHNNDIVDNLFYYVVSNGSKILI